MSRSLAPIATDPERAAPNLSIRDRFRGNPNKLPVSNYGGTTRYLGRQYEGGKLVHYRGWRENLRPYVDRAKAIAQGNRYSRHGFGYMGSVPRVLIHHWLNGQEKTWEDFATDKELKAKFRKWFETNYRKMLADEHRERPLSINRTKSGGRTMTRPKLGAQILNDYRKETSA